MFSSNCSFLICTQISQEAGKVVWLSHLLKNFPQFVVIYTVKGFGIINKAEVDVFLEFSCFFYDPMDVGNLISGSFAFSKYSLNICKFSVHVLLKPGLENFEHYFASLWDECNCAVVWIFFDITFLWYCERLLLNKKTQGFFASGGEFNLGPETRLDHSELLCNNILLKYKGAEASDIGIRRGEKEYPPASLQLDVI